MITKGAGTISHFDVPQLGGQISTARDEMGVADFGHRIDSVGVTPEISPASARIGIPQIGRVVKASHNELFLVNGDQKRYIIRIAHETKLTLPCRNIPQLGRFFPASGQHLVLIEGADRRHPMCVTFGGLNGVVFFAVPQFQSFVTGFREEGIAAHVHNGAQVARVYHIIPQ